MSERIQRRRGRDGDPDGEQQVAVTQPKTPAIDYDAVLAEIDEVLATDASEYVRSFVQKGGQ